jgi:hypothetical protein
MPRWVASRSAPARQCLKLLLTEVITAVSLADPGASVVEQNSIGNVTATSALTGNSANATARARTLRRPI